MAQDDYRQRFPDGDSAMPYVFVCNNPHELIVRYPMKVRPGAVRKRRNSRLMSFNVCSAPSIVSLHNEEFLCSFNG